MSKNQVPIRHGEYAGYQAHKRRNIPIDPDDSCGCRAANRQYMSNLRAKNAILAEKVRVDNMLRNRAFRKLARKHPAEFRVLLEKEYSDYRASGR